MRLWMRVVTAVMLAGCGGGGPTHQPCDDDSTCPEGLFCRPFVGCDFDCRVDIDCLEHGGGSCDVARGRCGGGAMDGGVRPDGSPPCTGDGECDDGTYCNGAESCVEGACRAGEPPCVAAECDEANDACGACVDPDLDDDSFDRVACGGMDCNDDNARIPGEEMCDPEGVDEDCNPMTVGSPEDDGDDDGYLPTTCCNMGEAGTCGTDCDDGRADVNIEAMEECELVDNNCDGVVDEGCTCTTETERSCGPTAIGECRPGTQACIDGVWETSCAGQVTPTAEVCNGLDDNCDGVADNGDPGGGGACGAISTPCQGTTHCSGGMLQCFPARAPTMETCNGIDDDCNGTTDGFSEPCSDACGSGMRACSGGTYLECSSPRSRSCSVTCAGGVTTIGTQACSPTTGWAGCSATSEGTRPCWSCGGWQMGTERCEISGAYSACSAPTSGSWGGLSYGECASGGWPYGDHICSGGYRYCEPRADTWSVLGADLRGDCGYAAHPDWYVPANVEYYCNVGMLNGTLPPGNYRVTFHLWAHYSGAFHGTWVDINVAGTTHVNDRNLANDATSSFGPYDFTIGGTLPISPSFHVRYRGSVWSDELWVTRIDIQRL